MFLYISVPLCFIDQHIIVWVIQSLILEPAAKYNIQSSAKQEAVCSYVNDFVLHKAFQNIFKILWHNVVIYPLIIKTENRNFTPSEPRKMEFLYYLCSFLAKEKLGGYYILKWLNREENW